MNGATDGRSGAGQPSPAPGARAERDDTSLQVRLAELIHLQVLQSLAAAQLQVELSQRLCKMGNARDAIPEMELASQQLQAAAEALQQVMRDLEASRVVPR